MTLENLLKKIVEVDGSDLHITVGTPPRVRKNGALIAMGDEKLMPDVVKSMVESKMNPEQLKRFNNGEEIDYSIGIPGLSRFRVNVFSQRGNIAAAYRRLPIDPPGLDKLGLPDSVVELSTRRKGLILITGATGSGKSTTMAALIHKITQELEGHVLTIEDPIEYLFPHSKAQVNQREVGVDTDSFASGLKSALRQDPDVVVVGELRDPESMGAALSIAETGHLVLSTLHTSSAVKTVDRIIDVFPAGQKSQIRSMLSESLIGIIAQKLLQNKEGDGRVPASEIMIANSAIKNLIREDKIYQIPSIIQAGSQEGMQSLDQDLQRLVGQGLVSKGDASKIADNSELFEGVFF